MPYQPTVRSNDAFASGRMHNVNEAGHQNDFTLGDDARFSDEGLADDSAKFNALVPHGVAASPASSAGGLSYEVVERQAGSAQPGQMGTPMDEMAGGSDSATWTSSEE